MNGIIAGAMAGGGNALERAGVQFGDYLSKSKLQEEQAEIMRLRDERLAELRKGELRYAEDLRREPGRKAQEEIDKAKGEFVDDPSGTVRQRTRSEMAEVEEGAYRRHGLVNEAMQARGLEQQRERDNQTRLDRTADNDRAERQLELQKKQFDVTAQGAAMDRQIKKITLENAERMQALRKEFATATPERKKAINEELQVLSGKDNDKFLPVPLKDETGAITGYRVFDTRAGKWVDDGGQAPKPGPKGERPPLESFFKGGEKKPEGAKPSTAPSGAASRGEGQRQGAPSARQYRPDLEAKDKQLAALRISEKSSNPNESARAWIAYQKRVKELEALQP